MSLNGGSFTGALEIEYNAYGCLSLYHTGSENGAGIYFFNDSGPTTKLKLGPIWMNEEETGLIRYTADGVTAYTDSILVISQFHVH